MQAANQLIGATVDCGELVGSTSGDYCRLSADYPLLCHKSPWVVYGYRRRQIRAAATIGYIGHRYGWRDAIYRY